MTRKVGRMVSYRLVDEHIRHLLTLGMTHDTGPWSLAQGGQQA